MGPMGDRKKEPGTGNPFLPNRTLDPDHETGPFPWNSTPCPAGPGSSWYFNRFMDPRNDEAPFGQDAVNYWRKVDLYVAEANMPPAT